MLRGSEVTNGRYEENNTNSNVWTRGRLCKFFKHSSRYGLRYFRRYLVTFSFFFLNLYKLKFETVGNVSIDTGCQM